MPLREERSFDADGPVGAYWLRNSTGFRVVTPRRRTGWVDEVGVRESDGRVDVLAVRKRGLFRSHVTLVPADRVTVVRPWEQTVVLAPRRRRRRPVAELPVAAAPAAARPAAREPETVLLPPVEPELELEPATEIADLPADSERTTRDSADRAEPEPTAETAAPDPLPSPSRRPRSCPSPEPEPPREPRLGPAMRTAGAASGRGLLAADGRRRRARPRLRALLAACSCGRSACSSSSPAGSCRRHAPTVGRFFAELAAFGAAAVTGLGRFTSQYVRTWRGELADWRAARRWQESRPEPPQQVRPPSPNGSRPGSAPTRSAPPSRRG